MGRHCITSATLCVLMLAACDRASSSKTSGENEKSARASSAESTPADARDAPGSKAAEDPKPSDTTAVPDGWTLTVEKPEDLDFPEMSGDHVQIGDTKRDPKAQFMMSKVALDNFQLVFFVDARTEDLEAKTYETDGARLSYISPTETNLICEKTKRSAITLTSTDPVKGRFDLTLACGESADPGEPAFDVEFSGTFAG